MQTLKEEPGKQTRAIQYIRIVALSAIIIGVVLRLTQLPTRVVYHDEAYTFFRVAGYQTSELINQVYNGQQFKPVVLRDFATVSSQHANVDALINSFVTDDTQHPPLFYILELFVVQLFGNTLIAWRLLPALCGILTLLTTYLLARKLFQDLTIALSAAALIALSPIERIYSDMAREYTMYTLLALAMTLALVNALRNNTLLSWAIYAFLATAGLYTNLFMPYVIVAQAIFVIGVVKKSSRLKIAAFLAASGVALLAYSPWLYEVYVHRADIAENSLWSGTRWPLIRLATKWVFNTSSTFFDLEYINIRWLIVLIPTMILATIAVVRGIRIASSEARWCLVTAIVIPAVLMGAPDVILGEHRSSVARYLLPTFTMLAILTAGGLFKRPLRLSLLLVVSLCSSVVGSMHDAWWDNDSNADDARIAAMISSVPNAQVVSTISPPEFIPFARLLNNNVRISLSHDLGRVQISAHDAIFVLRPTASDLVNLTRKTALTFLPVAYNRTRTAHDMGSAIGDKSASIDAVDLYRASTR